mgnify:FL=1
MKRRTQKITGFLLAVQAAALLLTGCGAGDNTSASPPLSANSGTVGSASPETPAPPDKTVPLNITGAEEIQEELYAAILDLRQPASMDLSGAAVGDTPELEIKNLYYEILNQHPELKYAYDLTAEVENGLLTCQISYMPYQTGYPQDWDGIPVASLPELIAAAEAHLGPEPVKIRLTDTALTPDGMNRALQQVGGGYILCSLSRDGTQLTYSPSMGMTMKECLALLEQAKELAAEAAGALTDGTMTEREQAEALYRYLTEHVKYDRRYYSDRTSMPYHSQTAIGALRDQVAICGGYSHALDLLFEQAGIPCYTVTGTSGGENHMWNIARLDGQWLWFDATADRGISPQFELRHFAREELDAQYSWDPMQLDQLLDAPRT